MSRHIEEREDRILLQDAIRKQPGTGLPRGELYEVTSYGGFSIENTQSLIRYRWLSASSLGPDLKILVKKDIDATDHLLKEGMIVPTFSKNFNGTTIRRLSHFDDVNFGLTDNGDTIIFKFESDKDMPCQIIRPDERCDAAINQLMARLAARSYSVSAPINLQEGIVRPIINKDTSTLIAYQRAFLRLGQ